MSWSKSMDNVEFVGKGSVPMKFEYCGGWGYREHVDNAIDKIEATPSLSGKFIYELVMDEDMTGRLEVTIDGNLVHSKQASGTYPEDDEKTFIALVEDALQEYESSHWALKSVNLKWSSWTDTSPANARDLKMKLMNLSTKTTT